MDEAQRKHREKVGALAESTSLFDFGDADTSEDDRIEHIRSLQKSPLLLLVMLYTDDFPLSVGDVLHNSVHSVEHPVTLLADGRVQTETQVVDSLSAAAHEYRPEKKQWPDGWSVFRYRDAVDQRRTLTLNKLLERNFERLGVGPDSLDSAEKQLARCKELGVEQHAAKFYDDAVRQEAKRKPWTKRSKQEWKAEQQ